MKRATLALVLSTVAFAFPQIGSADGEEASFPLSSVMQERIAKVKLHRIDGKRFRPAQMEKQPEYYVLYFSASWCAPCRAAAPDLAERYKANIAANPKVEFIFVSRDTSTSAAAGWAAKVGFPWPIVVPSNVARSKLLEFRLGDALPHCVMVNSAGERVADGVEEVFRKIEELAGGSE